ncbi:biotin--[acetyl-CoA-carboxylase] ligase [Microbacterium gorillae]|uniref:biotin--[acetyl-CoA-carboxylase] ligase n=1 Tax=Microbacterium gorillae TaxID=1231063 RepID=UPI00058ACF2B|nr:biotin--[acetyl-CoA-carboxylase] ligase [Microbacterium gorillae]
MTTTPAEGFPLTAAISPRVQVVEQTGSTNADLVVASADEAAYPHLSVLLTFDQRSGRGRLDRHWQAPAGSALALSTLLRVAALPVHARGWIPLAAGAAMSAAIAAQLPGHDVRVKWPNDVLVDDRKICGILAEATLALEAIVVGTGVNTAMASGQLPVPTATSFAVLGADCDVDRLIADYLTALDAHVRALVAARGDADASGLREAVVRACETIGVTVAVAMPDGSELRGVATGLDADGRLLVDDAGRITAVGAGDVTHVRR